MYQVSMRDTDMSVQVLIWSNHFVEISGTEKKNLPLLTMLLMISVRLGNADKESPTSTAWTIPHLKIWIQTRNKHGSTALQSLKTKPVHFPHLKATGEKQHHSKDWNIKLAVRELQLVLKQLNFSPSTLCQVLRQEQSKQWLLKEKKKKRNKTQHNQHLQHYFQCYFLQVSAALSPNVEMQSLTWQTACSQWKCHKKK